MARGEKERLMQKLRNQILTGKRRLFSNAKKKNAERSQPKLRKLGVWWIATAT
jgi:hypothetical protein